MRNIPVLIAVVCLAAIAGAQPPAAQEATLAELRRHAQAMLATLRALDVDGALALYDQSPTFRHVDNGKVTAWPELERQMRQFLTTAKENHLRWEGEPTIILLGNDAAVVFGLHQFSGVTADGTVIPPHTGVWTGVLRRIGGKWKIVHSHSSDAH